MADVMDRLAALEERVGALEDEIALYQLICSYGPAVDSDSAVVAAGLWTEAGVYAVGDSDTFTGQAEIAAMVAGPVHQSYIGPGAAHVMSLPRVVIRGDTAVAVNYSRLYLRDGEGFRVHRVSANRWDCVRTKQGWRVERRINRLLDGSAAARDLLGSVFEEEGGGLGTRVSDIRLG